MQNSVTFLVQAESIYYGVVFVIVHAILLISQGLKQEVNFFATILVQILQIIIIWMRRDATHLAQGITKSSGQIFVC